MADHPDYKAIAAELFAGDWTHRQVGEYVDKNKPAILSALETAAAVERVTEWQRSGIGRSADVGLYGKGGSIECVLEFPENGAVVMEHVSFTAAINAALDAVKA